MSANAIVIGLDGATWRVLDPLIDAGRMPRLAAFLEDAARGEFESVRPPISSPAWYAYSTGKDPGSLGIYGWRNFDPDTHEATFNAYDALDEPELWDLVGWAGKTSAVINVPVTFPPKQIEGAMVCGMQAEPHQAYTHPPELKDALEAKHGYRPVPKHRMRWDPDEAYDEILELMPTRFEAARELVDDVDLLHVTIFHIDELMHTAWGTSRLEAAFERLDEALGAFLDDLPETTDVVLMSDHGFGPADQAFNLSTWLIENGYLATEGDPLGRWLRAIGLHRDRLERGLRKVGLLNAAKRLVPKGLQSRVRERDGSASDQRRLPNVDWARTSAFASTNFTIHVLDEEQLDPIARELSELEDPQGRPVFDEVLHAEDVYEEARGPAPDLLLVPREGIMLSDELGEPLWEDLEPGRGDHRLEGILALKGPSFRTEPIEDARLIDLAPTLLHALELPVPRSMDGRVLDVFTHERPIERTSEAAARSPYTEEQLDSVEERLRGLGYL